jgi:hypothetical protein
MINCGLSQGVFIMNKILSGVEYCVTSDAHVGQLVASELVKAFKRAAVKKGFRLNPILSWDGANIASFRTEENVPFATMQSIMTEVAQATKLQIFLSASEDLLGRRIDDYPTSGAAAAVRKESFLKSAP